MWGWAEETIVLTLNRDLFTSDNVVGFVDSLAEVISPVLFGQSADLVAHVDVAGHCVFQ